ncbi:DUF5391 family protein [Shouchella lonarensis]|uniref:Uncharacterized protein n=1 Tax=Shouchella lonarensis TaxID=1464122 RepID=A0A1G6GPB1_9BACI|nr:DUF5391 family protein [Shouchella lonarensis]SDB83840.1 hypothetical protein SAMN05421737_101327 [Shouchella lonarensis]
MNSKRTIITTTVISALLMCAILISISLSPDAVLGPNGQRFGSPGMLLLLGKVILLYTVLFVPYMLGLKAMKYVMAIFNVLGLFITLLVVGVLPVVQFFSTSDIVTPATISLIIFTIAFVLTNVIWFVVAFRKQRQCISVS